MHANAIFFQCNVVSLKLEIEAEDRAHEILIVKEVRDLELRLLFKVRVESAELRGCLALFSFFLLSSGQLLL